MNEEHIAKVDAFIPKAERMADRKANKKTQGDKWSREFIAAMNHLTIKAGLRIPFNEEGA